MVGSAACHAMGAGPVSAHVTDRTGPWVVICNYPAWPSPYFAEMERHFPHALRLDFAAHPNMLAKHPGPPGVINLHRLKRLYRKPSGQGTWAAAEVLVRRLETLRVAGWRIVWTVHNLLPIDGGPPPQRTGTSYGASSTSPTPP